MILKSGTHMKVRCIRPFVSVELQPGGEVSICCTEWTKVPYIGNLRHKSLVEVWNSDTAQYIRRKMLAGEWEDVCNSQMCPILLSQGWTDVKEGGDPNAIFSMTQKHMEDIQAGSTFMRASPTYILMSNLDICNLKCPICGPLREVYLDHAKGDAFHHASLRQREIATQENLDLPDKVAREVMMNLPELKVLGLSGAGEPLLRPDTRKILFSKRKRPGIEFALFTNGLLLDEKMWKKIKHNPIRYVNVSVDAATPETYEALRKPGKWSILLDNLKFIGDLRKMGRLPVFHMNFTVMRSNLEEMTAFVHLGEDVGCDFIHFQRVRGRIWNKENFFDGPDKNAAHLKRLEKIKQELEAMSTSGLKVVFGNL